MLDCKPVDTPMDPNVKLVPGQGEPLLSLSKVQGLSSFVTSLVHIIYMLQLEEEC